MPTLCQGRAKHIRAASEDTALLWIAPSETNGGLLRALSKWTAGSRVKQIRSRQRNTFIVHSNWRRHGPGNEYVSDLVTQHYRAVALDRENCPNNVERRSITHFRPCCHASAQSIGTVVPTLLFSTAGGCLTRSSARGASIFASLTLRVSPRRPVRRVEQTRDPLRAEPRHRPLLQDALAAAAVENWDADMGAGETTEAVRQGMLAQGPNASTLRTEACLPPPSHANSRRSGDHCMKHRHEQRPPRSPRPSPPT
jgi:hypothetical protein